MTYTVKETCESPNCNGSKQHKYLVLNGDGAIVYPRRVPMGDYYVVATELVAAYSPAGAAIRFREWKRKGFPVSWLITGQMEAGGRR